MLAETGAADGAEPGQNRRSPDGHWRSLSGETRGKTFHLLLCAAVNGPRLSLVSEVVIHKVAFWNRLSLLSHSNM